MLASNELNLYYLPSPEDSDTTVVKFQTMLWLPYKYSSHNFTIFFSSWLTSQTRDGQLSEFISGLGPGQLVGRQVLGSPVLGDIQLSLCDKRGNLEVEVIRARGLQSKPGSKVLPGDRHIR